MKVDVVDNALTYICTYSKIIDKAVLFDMEKGLENAMASAETQFADIRITFEE